MPDLIAKSPLAGQGPLVLAETTLSEIAPRRITSVTPFKGRETELGAALRAVGLTFPGPNSFVTAANVVIVWTGRDQAFLIGGDATSLGDPAALSDQSDGWAGLRLDGPKAEEVLARLYPLDLRHAVFPTGRAARAPLNHMASILLRVGVGAFEILVFRSMARTAWHELETAMRAVASRASHI